MANILGHDANTGSRIEVFVKHAKAHSHKYKSKLDTEPGAGKHNRLCAQCQGLVCLEWEDVWPAFFSGCIRHTKPVFPEMMTADPGGSSRRANGPQGHFVLSFMDIMHHIGLVLPHEIAFFCFLISVRVVSLHAQRHFRGNHRSKRHAN